MKIRNGFVSNSSSSSFVVAFPRIPKDANDVRNMLFSPEEEFFYSPYGDDYYNVIEVANTVWNDICNQIVNDFESAKREFEYGTIDDVDAPNYNDYYYIKDYEKRYDAYDTAKEEYAKKKIKEFFNTRKLKLKKINQEKVDDIAIYVFEYSDNDGSYGATLEHGNLFRRLKHVRISKH